MFEIAFTPSSLDDMAGFHKRHQVLIFDETESQLSHQLNVETRRRKRLRPNRISEWELRIDVYRVFYDVALDAGRVDVRMVARKHGNRLYVRGQEFIL
jgi:mRNA-degrading endonuclease RelE of RelBE toxin-antitoxin system